MGHAAVDVAHEPSPHRDGFDAGQPFNAKHADAPAAGHEPSAQIAAVDAHGVVWDVVHNVGLLTHAKSIGQRNGDADGQPFNTRQLLSVATHEPSQHLYGVAASQPLATVP